MIEVICSLSQILLNAFGSLLEIMSLYAKRPIVEKVTFPDYTYSDNAG